MTDIQLGDKVRVIYEGVVEEFSNGLAKVGTNWIDLNSKPKVEIIEKRRPSVGDVAVPTDYPDLPEHTVLRHSGRNAATIVKVNGLWHYPQAYYTSRPFEDVDVSWDKGLTVAYLPPENNG